MDEENEQFMGWVARQVVRGCRTSKRNRTVHISLQEHYLRDDIPCGSPLCRQCRGPSSLPPNATLYLIPDASALIHFWEILELPQMTAVIFLSSVLKEVQAQFSGRQWRRLRSLFSDKRRGNLYFDDEHFIYTKLMQEKGAKQIQIKEVGHWFHTHLEKSISIIILTGIIEDVKEAKTDSALRGFQGLNIDENETYVKTMNVGEYVQRYWSKDGTVTDMCSSLVQSHIEWRESKSVKESKGADEEYCFNDYLPAPAIDEGLQDGSLHMGVFHVNKVAREGGFVLPSNKGEAAKLEVWIPAGKLQNRALHGDLVVVRVLSRDENVQSTEIAEKDISEELLDDTIYDDEIENPNILDNSSEKNTALESKARLVGEVVGIIQRLQRDYVACLDEMEESISAQTKRQEHVLCVPMDRRLPMVRIATRQRSHLIGQRFVIRIDGWDIDSKLPRGHVVKTLGPIGDLETENQAILVENDINILPFSSLSLHELPIDTDENPWCIPDKEYACRRDIRDSHHTYSIDPPGSKDVDDCLSVRQLNGTKMEIGVHIADVSFFVKEGSLLDLEAFSRGTTVYLVGNTYHMLPSILSENLCSLRYGKDRLAVSVIWTVDVQNDFEILDVWFGRTIIKSRQQMFYAQAQTILEDKALPEGWELHGNPGDVIQVQSDLSVLANFAQVCKFLRESKGALELVSAELRFELGDTQEPVSVESKTQLPMNWIVAEMMIQANSYVARRIYETFSAHALLRRHPPPKLDNFNFLIKCCEAQGLSLNASSNKALAASLDNIERDANPTVQTALKALATRAMSEAEYIAAGDALESYGLFHYGLALEFYTHFTSPIRRYADIAVHRMLITSCKIQDSDSRLHPEMASATDLSQVAGHLNDRHRASKRAQKQCNELHLLMYLQKHAEAEQAVVIELLSHALLVFVPKYDLRGRVHLQDKDGRIILPANDDKTDNESDISPLDKQANTLSFSENSVFIIDKNTGNRLIEYRRMTPVWVQLKADGSRAHSPTLRLRLLSDMHPAVQAYLSKNKNNNLEHVIPKKFKAQLKPRIPSDHGSPTTELNRDNKKGDQGDASPEAFTNRDTENSESSLHNLLSEFNETMISCSSVYLDDESDVQLDVLESSCGSISLLKADIAVSSEDQKVKTTRKDWQNKLFQAAIHYTKKTRSRSSMDSDRVSDLKLKETKARNEAQSLLESTLVPYGEC